MKKPIIAILIILGLVAAGYAVWFITKPKVEASNSAGPGSGPGTGGKSRGPAMVQSVPVQSEPVPILLDAVGTVEAEQSVAIRAEATGTLDKIFFREGDFVKAGQLLFQINAAAPQADVERARANLARDQATLAEARAQARRLAPLAQKEYVTRQEYAQAVAQEQAAAATARANQAELKSTQIQLRRTRIYAPISGHAGALTIKQGNLVNANSQDPLVILNSTNPVLVAFGSAQQNLQEIRMRNRGQALEVQIRRNADDPVLSSGKLAFIDNAIDPQTGSIKLKARVANENEALWPGELVVVRLILGVQENALVIPESAVQPGQNGPFVYLVDNGKAKMQPVTVARQVDAKAVISKGLRPGQQVIINAPQNLRPGAPVQLMVKEGAAGDKREGKGGGRPGKSSEAKPAGAQP